MMISFIFQMWKLRLRGAEWLGLLTGTALWKSNLRGCSGGCWLGLPVPGTPVPWGVGLGLLMTAHPRSWPLRLLVASPGLVLALSSPAVPAS